MWQRKIILALMMFAAVCNLAMSERQIPHPESYGKTEGAAAYAGKADVVNSPYFAQPDIYNLTATASLIILPQYKTYQQTTEYTCGPAVALTVVQHFIGVTPDDEMTIAKMMGTSARAGTTTKELGKYFLQKGWQVTFSRESKALKNTAEFKEFVTQYLRRGVPVMVENVEWGGHWRVIIGYDTLGTEETADDVLLMADPYDTADHRQDGYVVEPAEKFFYMWFDAGLAAANKRKQQWVVAEPPKADIGEWTLDKIKKRQQ